MSNTINQQINVLIGLLRDYNRKQKDAITTHLDENGGVQVSEDTINNIKNFVEQNFSNRDIVKYSEIKDGMTNAGLTPPFFNEIHVAFCDSDKWCKLFKKIGK